MPYKDPAAKKNWDEIRPDRRMRANLYFQGKEARRLKRLTEEALSEAGDESYQRRHAAFDNELSYDMSLAAQKKRLKL
jgi:hypothetical protein